MNDKTIRIFPLGDSALTVEFGNSISVNFNQRAIALANHFETERFPGFIESVPAYSSTTIFYDLPAVRKNFPESLTAFDAVKSIAREALKTVNSSDEGESRTVEIPVHFDTESALDLEFVSNNSGLSPDRTIEIFTGKSYRVFMLGFLPGFSYMGEVDDRIATTRKETPRTLVPKGSVGIAGTQTGIYSLASPGGWQVIGRTDLEMFTPNVDQLSYLRPGDEVKFIAIK